MKSLFLTSAFLLLVLGFPSAHARETTPLSPEVANGGTANWRCTMIAKKAREQYAAAKEYYLANLEPRQLTLTPEGMQKLRAETERRRSGILLTDTNYNHQIGAIFGEAELDAMNEGERSWLFLHDQVKDVNNGITFSRMQVIDAIFYKQNRCFLDHPQEQRSCLTDYEEKIMAAHMRFLEKEYSIESGRLRPIDFLMMGFDPLKDCYAVTRPALGAVEECSIITDAVFVAATFGTSTAGRVGLRRLGAAMTRATVRQASRTLMRAERREAAESALRGYLKMIGDYEVKEVEHVVAGRAIEAAGSLAEKELLAEILGKKSSAKQIATTLRGLQRKVSTQQYADLLDIALKNVADPQTFQSLFFDLTLTAANPEIQVFVKDRLRRSFRYFLEKDPSPAELDNFLEAVPSATSQNSVGKGAPLVYRQELTNDLLGYSRTPAEFLERAKRYFRDEAGKFRFHPKELTRFRAMNPTIEERKELVKYIPEKLKIVGEPEKPIGLPIPPE